jgi:hypothetical protein
MINLVNLSLPLVALARSMINLAKRISLRYSALMRS